MKKFMMKYLMLNCRQACLLMAKKEGGKLSFADNIRLKMHTSMCSICRKFEEQSQVILKTTAGLEQEGVLSDEAKVGMRRNIREKI